MEGAARDRRPVPAVIRIGKKGHAVIIVGTRQPLKQTERVWLTLCDSWTAPTWLFVRPHPLLNYSENATNSSRLVNFI